MDFIFVVPKVRTCTITHATGIWKIVQLYSDNFMEVMWVVTPWNWDLFQLVKTIYPFLLPWLHIFWEWIIPSHASVTQLFKDTLSTWAKWSDESKRTIKRGNDRQATMTGWRVIFQADVEGVVFINHWMPSARSDGAGSRPRGSMVAALSEGSKQARAASSFELNLWRHRPPLLHTSCDSVISFLASSTDGTLTNPSTT